MGKLTTPVATTDYLCCGQALEDLSGADRIGLAHFAGAKVMIIFYSASKCGCFFRLVAGLWVGRHPACRTMCQFQELREQCPGASVARYGAEQGVCGCIVLLGQREQPVPCKPFEPSFKLRSGWGKPYDVADVVHGELCHAPFHGFSSQWFL